MRDHFEFRKENQLSKDDKSLKQSWDSRIKDLCDKINESDKYYTTSSCSGRVVLLKSSKEKTDDLFVKVWHDIINFEELKSELDKIESNELIYFKQEPVILHVACRTLEDAQDLLDIAVKKAGWKRCGILASDKRFVVELNSTEKLEFPIYKDKVLVDDDYLKFVISEANNRLKSSWDKISRLQQCL